MSFDTTYQKQGLLEAAARYIIIRDQLLNERLDLTKFNQKAEAALIAAFLLQALCQFASLNQFNNHCPHFCLLKDEPFTRNKLKIV